LARDLKDYEWLKSNQPELATLLWVIGAVEELKVPLWKRILLYFSIIKLEPVVPKVDTAKLLPPSSEQ
jgi:hypothetical protein